MTKTISLLFISTLALLLFTGCVERELTIQDPNARGSKSNIWAEQTNIEEDENIDIFDIDENLAETETVITEELSEYKIERIAFPLSEYNALPRRGKGTIKGSIYVEDVYGSKVTGAGTRLYLNPVTSYSRQWYTESYIGGYKMDKADPRLFNYLRFTASNSEGKFAFYGVPSGQYYLIGTVKCGTECGYSTPKNIRIAKEVSVYGNQVVEQDLSRMLE